MAAAGGILVEDIPRGLSGEIISQYFFSRGGDIKAFRLFEGGRKALVEFEDTSGLCLTVRVGGPNTRGPTYISEEQHSRLFGMFIHVDHYYKRHLV